jgi:UDP-3-O-[3-hydroxymyristoyl] glucosamine N-acyltransferase
VPAGARWGGVPAKPAKQWFREMMILERLAARGGAGPADSPQAPAKGSPHE